MLVSKDPSSRPSAEELMKNEVFLKWEESLSQPAVTIIKDALKSVDDQ